MNSENSSVNLQERWSGGACPIINGIAFPSGVVRWLNVEEEIGSEQTTIVLEPASPTSLLELQQEGSLDWTQCTQLHEWSDQSLGLGVSCGEGGLGADGFVAVFNLDANKLIWLAFFECSNPFVGSRIEDDAVYAETTHGHKWVFPLESPERVTVSG